VAGEPVTATLVQGDANFLLAATFPADMDFDRDLWQQLVIRAYLDQQISLSKAAELLDMTRFALQLHFLHQGSPVRCCP
jgi:hypothetical protein